MTALYAILYPYTFMFALTSFMAVGVHSTNAWLYYSFVLASFSLPLMVVICIWKMWASYVQAKYKKAFWYAISPLAVLSIVIFCFFLLERR